MGYVLLGNRDRMVSKMEKDFDLMKLIASQKINGSKEIVSMCYERGNIVGYGNIYLGKMQKSKDWRWGFKKSDL